MSILSRSWNTCCTCSTSWSFKQKIFVSKSFHKRHGFDQFDLPEGILHQKDLDHQCCRSEDRRWVPLLLDSLRWLGSVDRLYSQSIGFLQASALVEIKVVSLVGHRRREPGTGEILAIRLGFAQLPHFVLLLPTIYKYFTAREGSATVMRRSFPDWATLYAVNCEPNKEQEHLCQGNQMAELKYSSMV